MDNKNMIIAVLSVTAVVLFCAVLLVLHSKTVGYPASPSLAWADNVDRGGDYVLATGAFSDTNEAVYVLDGSAERLHAYQYDKNRNSIVRYDGKDLRTYFGAR